MLGKVRVTYCVDCGVRMSDPRVGRPRFLCEVHKRENMKLWNAAWYQVYRARDEEWAEKNKRRAKAWRDSR